MTADEIRVKYARPGKGATAVDVDEVASVMAQNRDKLAERGERLQNLDVKMGRMVDDAANFAESARKLKEQQKASTLFGLFS